MKLRALGACALVLLLPLAAACSDDGSDGGSASSDGGTETDAGTSSDQGAGGSNGGGDLDVSGLSEQLQAGGLEKEVADCLAQAFDDADLSEDDVEKLQAGDVSVLSAEDLQDYSTAMGECVGVEMPEGVTVP